MNSPFEIVKKGEAKLEWGLHPDGRFWVRAICKVCNNPAGIAVGGKSVSSKNRNKYTTEAVGYSKICYREQRVNSRCKKGWTTSSRRTTLIKDMCAECSGKFVKYATHTLGHEGHCRSGSLPVERLSDAHRLFLRWRFARANTRIKRLIEQRTGKL